MNYELTAYLYAAALVGFGLIALWQARNFGKTSHKLSLGVIGFFLLFMAYFNVLFAFGYGVEPVAACEWLPQNATLSGNTTIYEYFDSCADDTTPTGLEYMFIINVWVFFIFMLVLFLIALVATINWWRGVL